MNRREFSWILVNLPENLSLLQKANLEKIKIGLAPYLGILSEMSFDVSRVYLISSYPNDPKELLISIPLFSNNIQKKRLYSELEKLGNPVIHTALRSLGITEIKIKLDTSSQQQNLDSINQDTANEFEPLTPLWNFKQIELEDENKSQIKNLLSLIEHQKIIFDHWGLRAIKPNPALLVNFYGPPGTGKTMTAHAVAEHLNKKILVLSYAQVESKYVGEGPKNLRKIFEKSVKSDCVLFFDEADSLLGQRIRHVTDGADQAINSMRSQLLIELDRFEGTVIFATNLASNYDFGFNNRLVHILFQLPNYEMRMNIWKKMLLFSIPGAADVDIGILSENSEGISGRDIRDTVLFSASQLACSDNNESLQEIILKYISVIKNRNMIT